MSENPSKLFLLDAMALIYRAHFALSKNPRINSSGINTGAVMGFTNTLLEIINKEKPSHIGVAFDTHAPTSDTSLMLNIRPIEKNNQKKLALPFLIVKKL